MNKRRVEEYLPKALYVLNDTDNCGIVETDEEKGKKIKKTYRGAISSFGAAVTMGSFKAAVAFFSDKGSSTVERDELIKAMYFIVYNEWKPAKEIYLEVSKTPDDSALKERFIDAAIALKLAMNAFYLDDEKEKKNEKS